MDKDAVRKQYTHYAELIAAAVARPPEFVREAESHSSVQVERGLVFPSVIGRTATGQLADVDRLIEISKSEDLPHVAVVDRGGHHRAVYKPLLVYCWLQAFRQVYETLPRVEFGRWEEGLNAWCNLLEAELTEIDWPPDGLTAARGTSAAEAAWMALCLHVAGKVFIRDPWTDLAADAFGRLMRGQQPGGAWLRTSPSDNPETHWYHELVVLHAAASYAVQAEDRPLSAAVAKNTAFHLNETQPDHATTQPWGIFAFLWNPDTRPLADGLLHATTVQNPSGGGVSFMLLADALYCLRLFLR